MRTLQDSPPAPVVRRKEQRSDGSRTALGLQSGLKTSEELWVDLDTMQACPVLLLCLVGLVWINGTFDTFNLMSYSPLLQSIELSFRMFDMCSSFWFNNFPLCILPAA